MDKYEVWHKKSGDLFPDNYELAAKVFADGLQEVVEKTQDNVSKDGEIEPWSLCSLPIGSVPYAMLFARDTKDGDVIVDPAGNAHRYDGGSFMMIRPAPEKSNYERILDEPRWNSPNIDPGHGGPER